MAKRFERRLLLVNTRKELGLSTSIKMDAVSVLLNPESDFMTCEKCGSLEIGKHWIDTQQILHCICIECNYEWIE